jgi:HEAT repeat protein
MCTKLWIALLLMATCAVGQPEKTAWDILKQGLADKNPEKRRQAVTAIGSIGLTPDAIQQVEGALQDQDSLVRQTAAATLGQMKAKQSIPALKKLLDDAAPEVTFAAAKALWDMGDKSGRDLIEDVLTGQQKATESALSGAKRKLHDPKALTLMGFKEASGVLLGPFNIGIIAAEQAFKDGGGGARALSATMLAQDCDAQTLRLLEYSATSDKNWAVKAASARALGQCGNQEAIPRLEQNLGDGREAVKFMSAAAIIRLSQKTRASLREVDQVALRALDQTGDR